MAHAHVPHPHTSGVNAEFDAYLKRKQAAHGSKFDPSMLAAQFMPYYHTGERIKVRLDGMERELTGTVGVTTGWKPVFLLMRTARSLGSPYTLSDRDRITAVKRGRKYVPLSMPAPIPPVSVRSYCGMSVMPWKWRIRRSTATGKSR